MQRILRQKVSRFINWFQYLLIQEFIHSFTMRHLRGMDIILIFHYNKDLTLTIRDAREYFPSEILQSTPPPEAKILQSTEKSPIYPYIPLFFGFIAVLRPNSVWKTLSGSTFRNHFLKKFFNPTHPNFHFLLHF